jgi:FkbM family methyltransferase
MADALDLTTPRGKIGELIFRPLSDPKLAVVDVGARNGMFLLPATYTRRAELIGFEPNEDEYRMLRERRTEAIAQGAKMPRFREETFHDCALWDAEEERTFYITAGVGASTMMGEALPSVAGRMFRGSMVKDGGLSMYERHFAVRETAQVKCRRLDALVGADRTVDFLKIDVEGAEMHVLRGAEALFAARRVLCIMTEFAFTPYYAEHPLLGDQQTYLGSHGFRLLDLQHAGRTYSRDRSRIPEANDRRPIYGGDAWFALDPDRVALTPEERQRLAAILLVFGFHSFAMSLLRDAKLTAAADIDAIETALMRVPLRRRLRDAWATLPVRVHGGLTGLRRRLGA